MIDVVDVGCMDFGYQDSIGSLVDTYRPRRLYGFDPHPRLDVSRRWHHGVPVVLRQAAAWLYDGEVLFYENGTSSKTAEGATLVPCIDFSGWLQKHARRVVLKMDVEGAEYELLGRMADEGTDQLVEELLIEWHGDDTQAAAITARLACPTRQWWM